MDINNTQELGAILKELRKKADLSQEALALRTNLSRTAIQNLERGKPTLQLSTLFPVLEFLNVTLSLHHLLLEGRNEK